MDISTLVFLGGMAVAVGYASYIGLCDAYALINTAIEDIGSHSFMLKLHID